MNKTFYRCIFSMTGKKLETDIPDIATAKEGFWTDEHYMFTTKSDNVWWIPPSSVICVKKETREVL